MTFPLIVRNHAFLPLSTTLPSPAGYLFGGWGHRLPGSYAAGLVTADQTDLVVLVKVTDATLATIPNHGLVTNANGFDIVFTAGDGATRLPHETISYTASTGTIVAWVRFPSFLAASANTFYVYYGNAAVTTTQDLPFDVWSGLEQTVYRGSIASSQLFDSAGGARHGAITGAIAQGTGPGPLPAAVVTSGNIQLPPIPMTLTTCFTAWFNCSAQAAQAYILSCFNAIVPQGMSLSFLGSGTPHGFNATAQSRGTTAGSLSYTSATSDTAVWHHIAIVFDVSAGFLVYYDGALVASGSTKNVQCAPGQTIYLAQKYDGTGQWIGSLADVRFSRISKTVDRILAERSMVALIGSTWAPTMSASAAVPTVTKVTTIVPSKPIQATGLIPITLLQSDHNAFYQPVSSDVLIWSGYPLGQPCAPEITPTCWQGVNYNQDAHSTWYDYTSPTADPVLVDNVNRYLQPSYYQVKPYIEANCCVRMWSCTGNPGGAPCTDTTAVTFIQHVENNSGVPLGLGFSDELIHSGTAALFALWTWCGACDANGLATGLPTHHP